MSLNCAELKHDELQLQRLYNQLHQLHLVVQKHKSVLENACRDSRNLLKPWPIRKHKQKQEHEQMVDKAKHEGPQVVENPELVLANKVLIKAEKARKLQEKLNKTEQVSETSKVKTEPPVNKASPNTNTSQNLPPVAPEREKGAKEMTKSTRSASTFSARSSHHSAAKSRTQTTKSQENCEVISQSKLNSILKTVKPDMRSKTPAYTKAPFQTMQPVQKSQRAKIGYTVTKPSRNKDHGSLPGRTLTSGRSRGQIINKSSQLKKDHSVERKSVNDSNQKMPVHCSAVQSKAEDDCERNNNNSSLEEPNEDQALCLALNTGHKQHPHVTDQSLTDKFELMSVSGSKQVQNYETADTKKDTEQQKSFNLLTDGHTLPIPGKLRKTCHTNLSLRRKLYKLHIVKRIEETTPRKHFFQRISNYIKCHGDPSGETVQNLKEYTNLYLQLTDRINSLQDMPIDDSSSWQDVAKAKRTMEYVCSTFFDTESSYRCLLNSTRNLKSSQVDRKYIDRINQPNLTWQWLPQELDSHKLPVMLSSFMRYRDLHQLERHSTLLHEVQLLQLRQWIQNKVREDILPGLKAEQRPPLQLYRAVYSLLCHGGNVCPIMVADTISDDVDDS